MFELLFGRVLRGGRERLLQLCDGPVPTSDRVDSLFGLRGWDIFRRGRSFCFERLHFVRGRVLLVSVGRVVLCMLRRKFRRGNQRFQLRHMRRWIIFGWDG